MNRAVAETESTKFLQKLNYILEHAKLNEIIDLGLNVNLPSRK